MNERKIINKRCYVAFLDILGFSDYVLKHEIEEVKEIFDLLDIILENMKKDRIWSIDENYEKNYNQLVESIYSYVMSDSIILALECELEYSLEFLMKYSAKIQQKLIEKELLLRGGISVGRFWGEGNLNIGRGLVHAHDLETKAKMPIIVIDKMIKLSEKHLPLLDINIKEYNEMIYIDSYETLIQSVGIEAVNKIITNGKGFESVRKKYTWFEKEMEEHIVTFENESELQEIPYEETQN